MCSSFGILVLDWCLYVLWRRLLADKLWGTLSDVRGEVSHARLLCANRDSANTLCRIVRGLIQLIVQHVIKIFLAIISSIIVRQSLLLHSLLSFSAVEILA